MTSINVHRSLNIMKKISYLFLSVGLLSSLNASTAFNNQNCNQEIATISEDCEDTTTADALNQYIKTMEEYRDEISLDDDGEIESNIPQEIENNISK